MIEVVAETWMKQRVWHQQSVALVVIIFIGSSKWRSGPVARGGWLMVETCSHQSGTLSTPCLYLMGHGSDHYKT